MIIYLKLADYYFKVDVSYPRTKALCYDYLVDDSQKHFDAEISITLKDILAVSKIESVTVNSGKTYKQFLTKPPIINYSYWETVALQLKIADWLLWHNTLLIHGAVVAYNGYSYMFTAPSGTGKSTRAKLWLNEFPGSFIVNGDKPFVKIANDTSIAFGTPWCGKEDWGKNVGVPLKAIFILERTHSGEETSIIQEDNSSAYISIYQQVYKSHLSEDVQHTLSLLKQLLTTVKIFRFRSNPDSKSIRLAYEIANSHGSI